MSGKLDSSPVADSYVFPKRTLFQKKVGGQGGAYKYKARSSRWCDNENRMRAAFGPRICQLVGELVGRLVGLFR